jgi:hypothetical protein
MKKLQFISEVFEMQASAFIKIIYDYVAICCFAERTREWRRGAWRHVCPSSAMGRGMFRE